MDDRTVAFIGAGVTILAWIIFWNGLLRGWAVTHPDSTNSDALLKLIG